MSQRVWRIGRRVLEGGGARKWPSAAGETAMACLPVAVVSTMELRREGELVRVYLCDCLASAIDGGHL